MACVSCTQSPATCNLCPLGIVWKSPFTFRGLKQGLFFPHLEALQRGRTQTALALTATVVHNMAGREKGNLTRCRSYRKRRRRRWRRRRRRPWVVSWRPQIRPPAARSVAEWLYPGGPRPWRARNAWKCRLGREDREDRREDCRKKCEDREDRGVRKRGEGGSLFLRGVLTVLTCFTTVLTPVLTGPHGPHGPEEGPPLLLSTAPTAPRFSRRPPLRPPRSPRSPQGAPMAPTVPTVSPCAGAHSKIGCESLSRT